MCLLKSNCVRQTSSVVWVVSESADGKWNNISKCSFYGKMNDFVLDICHWGLWILIFWQRTYLENHSIISWYVWMFEHSESSITNIYWAGTGILNTRIRVFPEIFAFSNLSLNKESFPTCFGIINIGKCRKRLIFLLLLMKSHHSDVFHQYQKQIHKALCEFQKFFHPRIT